MTHGVPYFYWRDGRPRWMASAALRRYGWRGRDLKDANGNWLPLKEAIEACEALNREVAAGNLPPDATAVRRQSLLGQVYRRKRRQRMRERVGFVYFIVCGELVKIGFSNNPVKRLDNLMTGMPEEVSAFVSVRGTQRDEARLIESFDADRKRGEWFYLTTRLDNLIAQSFRRRRVDFSAGVLRGTKGKPASSHRGIF
jgi:hypothetical protein